MNEMQSMFAATVGAGVGYAGYMVLVRDAQGKRRDSQGPYSLYIAQMVKEEFKQDLPLYTVEIEDMETGELI